MTKMPEAIVSMTFNIYREGEKPDASNAAIARVAHMLCQSTRAVFIGLWEQANLLRKWGVPNFQILECRKKKDGEWITSTELLHFAEERMVEQNKGNEIFLVAHPDHSWRAYVLASYFGFNPFVVEECKDIPYDHIDGRETRSGAHPSDCTCSGSSALRVRNISWTRFSGICEEMDKGRHSECRPFYCLHDSLCYTKRQMDYSGKSNRGRNITMRGVSFALVAAVAFCIGLFVGNKGSATAIITHMPLVGDGLDATPDQSADLADFWKAWNALDENYVITHASSTLPSTKDKIYGAISGLANSYGDPYTVFFPPTEAKQFSDTISGSFAGIGTEIDIKDNVLTVIAPLKGTPAEQAGIKAGDQIVAIDGKSTEGIAIDKAVNEIRGAIGTTVDLSIVRNKKLLDIKVVRNTIQVPETDDGLDTATGVYHIALYEFTANSATLFDQAFERFKASGSKKLIIDLRGNPGGYLDAAVDIASHFMPKGATIVTEDSDGKAQSQVDTSLGYDDVPAGTKIVVLIDNGSASASEILAGALQDSHTATLIGTKSFGKGSVQTLINIDGGSLKVTVARWITPAGHWIMGNGITPDIIVQYAPSDATTTPKVDPQMARAIQFLTTGK